MKCAMLVLLSLTVPHSSAKNALTWTKISSNGPSVSAHYMGYDPKRHQLFVFGGREGGFGIVNHTRTYDIATNTWERHATDTTVLPEPRFSLVGAVSAERDAVYITTGEGRRAGKKFFFNDVWKFDLSTRKWTQVDKGDAKVLAGGNRPIGRYGAVGGLSPKSPDKFWMSHGFSSTRYSDTWFFNLKKNKWTRSTFGSNEYAPLFPHGRCLGCAGFRAQDKDSFVMFGGCLSGGGSGGPCPAGDTWTFKPNQWEIGPLRPTPRSWCSMVQDPRPNSNDVFLYGGTETAPTRQTLYVDAYAKDDLYIFDSKNTWQRIKVQGPSPDRRQKAAMAYANNIKNFKGGFSKHAVFMHGGSPGGTEVWRLQGDWTKNTKVKDNPYWFNLIFLHGIMMFVGWGVLLQLGAFSARHLRKFAPLWFQIHWICNTIGIIIAFFGLIPAYMSVLNRHFQFTHGGLGLVIMILGIANPVMAAFRCHPKKEEDQEEGYKWPTPARFVFNMFHHYVGRLAIILALINITLGIFLVLAPVYLIVLWFVYLTAIAVAYIYGEWHIRTYGRFKKDDDAATDKADTAASTELSELEAADDQKED